MLETKGISKSGCQLGDADDRSGLVREVYRVVDEVGAIPSFHISLGVSNFQNYLNVSTNLVVDFCGPLPSDHPGNGPY